ncbi:MAG: hypothetical protein F4Y35_02535 [Chloroflexi bacterium]|nr:hypothetical protein [Chloroflexota bacterium]
MDTTSNDAQSGDVKDEDAPLLVLLRALAEEQGRGKAADRLGVDRKTIWRALDAGRLTPRLRDALEQEQAAAAREAAGSDQLERRLGALEQRLQDVEQQLAGVLSGLGEELAGLRERVETLGWSQAGASGPLGASVGASLHRSYPELVTAEPLPDDEQVLGQVLPLVAEWREQQARFERAWPAVEGLEAEVRMLALELALIGEHGLTLPPGKLPWRWDLRERELQQRRRRLAAAGRRLRRARWRSLMVRALTGGRR